MNQNINYQKELDKKIKKLQEENVVPTLLIHSCCAPCSSYVLEYLSQYFHITVLYYNPNIYPPQEYEVRALEQQRLIDELEVKYPIKFIAGRYEPDEFYTAAKGYEKEPEGGERCFRCYHLRLEEAAKIAKEMRFDYFTTTLTISPLKKAAKLNQIGEELGKEYGVEYLMSDFKKKEGYKRSIELSNEHHLYRQNYCGCVYSKVEADQREKSKQ
ncbi:MAG: epoxyqueuosine reductase QueH [Clostridiales bacterium]|nr:epoxyqueuosine reductase QueH [Clostridiales bacterium]